MATGVAEALAPSSSHAPTYSYPPVIIILTIVLLMFFFAGFFSIYFCRCFMQNLLCTWHLRRGTGAGAAPPAAASGAGSGAGAGLDPAIVESFPRFTYSTVKDYTKEQERYGLECAICLVEFRSSDVLRLLTACCHVFHQECIDLWLDSHRTCPVCRRNLNSPVPSPSLHDATHSIAITINEDHHQGSACTTSATADKFSRSHSTGHSITRNREGEERYTLILPEEVKSQIIRGHNSSKSWTNFGEYNNIIKDKETSVAEPSGLPAGDHKL